ncbi:MAG: hypothetical protein NTY76_00365 [Candidatus Omnitrophica bacterium]|nr:hypothetical protein [Candidatus Omnitrophota bacterium]
MRSINWPDRINFPLAFSLVFLLLGFIGIVHHEMWRDELQAWMIARDNTSLAGLVSTVRYEGHPIFWYLGLYAITRFTHNPFAMQVFHILIASAGIWVFARFSPFTKLQKALFAFGFFPFYEYAIKSRGYALGILLLFLFCVFYKDRSKKYILISCVLFIMCQTSVLGLLIAISLQAMLIFELLSDGAFRKNINKLAVAVMLIIFLAGIAASLWQIMPPGDSTFAANWHLQFDGLRMERIFSLLSRAYLCSPYYWCFDLNSGAYQAETLFPNLCLSAALFLFISMLFRSKPKILFLYICGTAVFLTFFYVKYGGFSWHHGHLYILLIACFWLSAFYPDTPIRKRLGTIFVTIILAIHFYQGAMVYAKDYSYPFSASKDAARFIEDSGLKSMLIAGDLDYAVSPIAGYLDKKIYYLREGRFATYVQWDDTCRKDYDPAKLREEPALQNKKSLLVVNEDLKVLPGYMTKVKEFTSSMVPDEKYYLYLLDFEK